jgi:hypothetical protein
MLLEAVVAGDKEKTTGCLKVATASLPYTASKTPNVDGSLYQAYFDKFLEDDGLVHLIDILKASKAENTVHDCSIGALS